MPLHLGSSSCPSFSFSRVSPATCYSYRVLFSCISDRNASIFRSLRSTGRSFRRRERKDAGKTVERFLENHAPSYFHRGKKVNRTNDRKRRRWSNAFPPSLRTPVHSFSSSSLPLAKEEKKKKDLDRRKSKWKREREKEGEMKGSVNGTVGKMAGRVYNSTRTDGRWFVLSSGRTVGCRQKNYYA